MSDKPTIVLGEEQDCYNKQMGDFDTYIPVEVRVSSKEKAKKVAQIISEHWSEE